MAHEQPRYDLYGPIHKGLRLALGALLVRMGAADFADPEACGVILQDLRRQMALSVLHLEDEDRFIHSALAECDAGAAVALGHAHDAHRRTLADVAAVADALEAAPHRARPALGQRLYLEFSRFVAEDFAHMHDEETVFQPLLQLFFTDAELAAIEQRIVTSLAPTDFLDFLRVMLPAMTPAERRDMLTGIRQGAPGEVFDLVIATAKPALDEGAWRRLVADMRLAA